MVKRARQGELVFRSKGGQPGRSGRKPKNGVKAMVGHDRRAALASRFPVHANLKLRAGLPSLRRNAERRVLLEAFAAGCDRAGFRLVQFSIQANHLHFICEAKSRTMMSRGMQGLAIRVAKRLNKLWGRKGGVFADRYHDEILRSPRQVRNVLVYVLQNARKHGLRLAQRLDVFSSAAWFDGWNEALTVEGLEGFPTPVAAARTWLLEVGWRKHGRLGFDEVPRLR
jgi:putative transposase